MLTQENDSNIFSFRVYYFHSHRELTTFFLSAMNSLLLNRFKSNQTSIGYHQDKNAPITPLVISGQPCHCCDSQTLHLNRTIDCFSHLAAFIIPLDTQFSGSRFLYQFQLHFSNSCAKVCVVFSNRGLPLSYGRQPRATAIACIILGVTLITWPWEFCQSMALRMEVLSPHVI